MKKWYHSLIMTFSMYSKLPMPEVEWKKENKEYAFALFPLVGAVEMALFLFVYRIWNRLRIPERNSELLIGIVLTILPILYTGGIHMDGFMDTCDALGSHASRERKLEIMKDSHVGSAAVLWTILYVMVYYLGMSRMQMRQLPIFGFSLIAERAVSVFCLLHFPIAPKNGMAADFVHSSDISSSKIILTVFFAISILGAAWFDRKTAAVLLIYFMCAAFWYAAKMRREIGGLTGDTAGFFLQVTEIGALWLVLILY